MLSFAHPTLAGLALLTSTAVTTALLPTTAAANAFFQGDVSADYEIAYVSADGYEEASTWVAVDGIRSEYAGPMAPPPLAIVVRLSASFDPRDPGHDVAWWPLGSMPYGAQRHDLIAELAADDIPAGEYWVHTLLVEDDRWQTVVDARTASRPQLWRGGIDVAGNLYVDHSDPYSLYMEIPEILNNRLQDDSRTLEVRFYTTFEPGPAADGTSMCAFSLQGLWVGESYRDVGFRCDLNAPLYDDERVHVEVRERGAPVGDVISEPLRSYRDPDLYVYAGSLSWTGILLLGLLGRTGRPRQRSVQGKPQAGI